MQAGLHLRVYKQRVKKFLSKEEFRDPDACLAVTPSMQVTECEKKCAENSDLGADKHEHAEGWLWHARPRCPGFTRHSTRPCYHQVLDVCDAALFHRFVPVYSCVDVLALTPERLLQERMGAHGQPKWFDVESIL